jgi:hypothetical protein
MVALATRELKNFNFSLPDEFASEFRRRKSGCKQMRFIVQSLPDQRPVCRANMCLRNTNLVEQILNVSFV